MLRRGAEIRPYLIPHTSTPSWREELRVKIQRHEKYRAAGGASSAPWLADRSTSCCGGLGVTLGGDFAAELEVQVARLSYKGTSGVPRQDRLFPPAIRKPSLMSPMERKRLYPRTPLRRLLPLKNPSRCPPHGCRQSSHRGSGAATVVIPPLNH